MEATKETADTITMPRLEHERDTAAAFRTKAELETLRAENARLREALTMTAALLIEPGMIATGSPLIAAVGAARAALGESA